MGVSGIRKTFPGVVAIRSANLKLQRGEIHSLLGANGAGKSTLVKILTGIESADDGEISLDGAPVRFHSSAAAFHAGIAAIYQEFSLVPTLSVRANLFLGHERTRGGIIDEDRERELAESTLARLGVRLPLDALVGELSVGHQQLIEIGRALVRDARVLIMDEPTAALSPHEVERLSAILRELTAHGIGILFISHRLEEVLALSDCVTVMRDGLTLPTMPARGLNRNQLIEMMVGRSLAEEFPRRSVQRQDVALDVLHLSGGRTRDISFRVRRGEVLGLGGLVGAGRTEVARLIYGADRMERGEITVDGRRVTIRSSHDAIGAGICLLTEDRKTQGLVPMLSARENFALGNLGHWSRWGWIDASHESDRFGMWAGELALRISGSEQRAAELSGGNQQKLLLGRWLETSARVLLFDEPTRGIDVAAKQEMYVLINRLASQGKAIVVISSEFPELLGICDRILVMREGTITGEITDVARATQESIMALAV